MVQRQCADVDGRRDGCQAEFCSPSFYWFTIGFPLVNVSPCEADVADRCPPVTASRLVTSTSCLAAIGPKLDQRIDGLSAQVSKMDRIGDDARVSRRTQRTIRALERDVRGIDRMRDALRLRLEILSIGA